MIYYPTIYYALKQPGATACQAIFFIYLEKTFPLPCHLYVHRMTLPIFLDHAKCVSTIRPERIEGHIHRSMRSPRTEKLSVKPEI